MWKCEEKKIKRERSSAAISGKSSGWNSGQADKRKNKNQKKHAQMQIKNTWHE